MVGFTVRHLGLAKVRGRFDGVEASLTVGDDPESSVVSAVVDMSTVNTGNDDRDTHLRSSDFFNVDASPKMNFTSTSITGSGEENTLVGDLSINGVSRQVEFEVEFFGTSVFPMDQSTRAGFSGATISRKDCGIQFNVPLGGDKVTISDKVDKVTISDKVVEELDLRLVAPGGKAVALASGSERCLPDSLR